MSPKSRPPKSAKKGKKGKHSATTVVVEEEAGGPPFGIVVLFAVVMTIPSFLRFAQSTMKFDETILRFLAALAVSWILVHLVYAVAMSFSGGEKTETTTTTTTLDGGYVPPVDPNAHYRTTVPDNAEPRDAP